MAVGTAMAADMTQRQRRDTGGEHVMDPQAKLRNAVPTAITTRRYPTSGTPVIAGIIMDTMPAAGGKMT